MGGEHFSNSIKPSRAPREHLVIAFGFWNHPLDLGASDPEREEYRGQATRSSRSHLLPGRPLLTPLTHSLARLPARASLQPPLRRTRTSAGATHSAARAAVAAAGWSRQALSAPQAGPGRPSPGPGCCSCQRGSWLAPRSLGAQPEVPGAWCPRLRDHQRCLLSCLGQRRTGGLRSWHLHGERLHRGAGPGSSYCPRRAAGRFRQKLRERRLKARGGSGASQLLARRAALGGLAGLSRPALWSAGTLGLLLPQTVPKETVLRPRVPGRR